MAKATKRVMPKEEKQELKPARKRDIPVEQLKPAKKRVAPSDEKNPTTPPPKELKPGIVTGKDVKVRILKATSKNRKGHVVTMDEHAAKQMIAGGIAEVYVDDGLNLKSALKLIDEHGGEVSVLSPNSTKGSVLVAAMAEAEIEAGEMAEKISELEKENEDLKKQIEDLSKPVEGKTNAGNKS